MILWFIRGITHTLTAAWYNFIYYSQSLLSYFIPETKVKDDAETARPKEQLAKDVNQQEIANKAEQQEAAAIAELQNMSLGLRLAQLEAEKAAREAEREACISALIAQSEALRAEREERVAQRQETDTIYELQNMSSGLQDIEREERLRANIEAVIARARAQSEARSARMSAEIAQLGARIEAQGARMSAEIEAQGARMSAEIAQLGAQLRTVIRAEIERRSHLTQASSSSLSFNVFLEEDLSSAVIANFAKVAEQHWETINTKSTDITSFTYPTLL
jgi:hypothetical protein